MRPAASTTTSTAAVTSASTDLPFGLPLPPLPSPLADILVEGIRRARGVVERLPAEPPSFLLAQLLNRALLPRLDEAARARLARRVVEIRVSDLGIRCRLTLGSRGFEAAARRLPTALRIAASAPAFWALASGREDADTLFFERALVMEGDTEYALLLKNTLDAIGPLDPLAALPGFLRPRD